MDRSLSRQVLLFADANPENGAVLKTMLAPDYDIIVAADEEEAIKLASSPEAPGLILLNDLMPTEDLYAICRKLKTDNTTRDIPIILLSTPKRIQLLPEYTLQNVWPLRLLLCIWINVCVEVTATHEFGTNYPL